MSYIVPGKNPKELPPKEGPNKALFQNLAEHAEEVQQNLNFTSNVELKVDDPNDVDSVAHAKIEAQKLND